MTLDLARMNDPDFNPQFRRFADAPIRLRGEGRVSKFSPPISLRPRGPAKKKKRLADGGGWRRRGPARAKVGKPQGRTYFVPTQ